MEKKIDFIVNSINDIQSTIRAIDAKLFATIVLLLLPLTELEIIIKSINGINCCNHSLAIILSILLILLWLLGLLSSFFGIYSISNPSKRIDGLSNTDVKGIFYQPNLFKFSIVSSFLPIKIKSFKNLPSIIKEMKIDCNNEFNELVFEQVKLVYIRDVKIARQKATVFFLLSFVILLAGILIFHFVNS